MLVADAAALAAVTEAGQAGDLQATGVHNRCADALDLIACCQHPHGAALQWALFHAPVSAALPAHHDKMPACGRVTTPPCQIRQTQSQNAGMLRKHTASMPRTRSGTRSRGRSPAWSCPCYPQTTPSPGGVGLGKSTSSRNVHPLTIFTTGREMFSHRRYNLPWKRHRGSPRGQAKPPPLQHPRSPPLYTGRPYRFFVFDTENELFISIKLYPQGASIIPASPSNAFAPSEGSDWAPSDHAASSIADNGSDPADLPDAGAGCAEPGPPSSTSSPGGRQAQRQLCCRTLAGKDGLARCGRRLCATSRGAWC